EVPSERISVCPHGRPDWMPRAGPPAHAGYVLFLGTLEPRKNVVGLLDAYERVIQQRVGRHHDTRRLPQLVLAGRMTAAARPWLERIAKPPLQGAVRYIGYVDPARRREGYEGARLLVQPSFEEGFGLPVLEAMTLGVPVVAANRGSLPELLGDAGRLVDPDDIDQIASAIEQMLDDDALAGASAAKGILRAGQFDWRRTAQRVYDAYHLAIEH